MHGAEPKGKIRKKELQAKTDLLGRDADDEDARNVIKIV